MVGGYIIYIAYHFVIMMLVQINIDHYILDVVVFFFICSVHLKVEAIGEVGGAFIVANASIALVMFSVTRSPLFSWSNLQLHLTGI